ncbi:MAG TPA: AsmA family protein [Candidatus Acidoferrales bacterium]|jgi:AsmA protein|nr:AsmA family protein [Candidatus Acidoferrales bacterium]
MKSKLKWIGIAILAVIVILLVLPFVIPVNSFRPTIEQQASQALGRKVTVGNLSLSILGGSLGMDDLTISDDPKFNSGPFLTAKEVKVGVELMPLIFSKELNVTEISIVKPQVVMLKDPSGKWNFSSVGGNSASAPKSPSSGGGGSGQSVSVKELSLKDGQITLGNTNSQKRSVYNNVDLTASDVSMTNNFPVTLSMDLPGGGDLKVDGKVGPVDQTNAAFTPQNVKLTVDKLDLAKGGFLDPSLGLAGMVDVTANLVSQGGHMTTKGQLTLTKAVLVAGGSPSGVPAVIDFDTNYDMASGSGVLNPSSLKIGNAKTNLNGTYKSVSDEFVVDMKVDGQGLPATDLETFLPALAINLPSGSKLTAGTLSTNLHVTGPTNKLVTDGTIGLYNGKLSGFDLGQKMSGVAALAGLKTGKDLDIEKFTSNVHMAPTGLRADNLDLVVPSLGTVVGGGTLDSKNNMDFKLVATVNAALAGAAGSAAMGAAGGALGGLTGAALGGGSNCKSGGIKVPLQVHGTTSNPQFVPDVGGAAASMLKSELACGAGGAGNVQGLAKGLTGTGTGGATSTINQLGGLLGGKKKQ